MVKVKCLELAICREAARLAHAKTRRRQDDMPGLAVVRSILASLRAKSSQATASAGFAIVPAWLRANPRAAAQ